mmetsp:Transcript_7947/g.13182  ORF Transcript_7947/g.13182 Transcript_7947/m.13182 type:complete len:89 (+) Transcript_7947:350-616(+)
MTFTMNNIGISLTGEYSFNFAGCKPFHTMASPVHLSGRRSTKNRKVLTVLTGNSITDSLSNIPCRGNISPEIDSCQPMMHLQERNITP